MKKILFNKSQGFLLAIIFNINILIALKFPFSKYLSIICVIGLILISVFRNLTFKVKDKLIFNFVVSFLLLACISLTFNISIYSFSIFIKYLIITYLCFVSSRLDLDSIKLFLKTTVVLNIFLSIVGFYDLGFILQNQNTNYLSATYTLGISFITLFILTYLKFSVRKLALTIFFFFSMLQFPSRGTILFSLVVIFFFTVKHRPRRSKKAKFIFYSIVVVFLFLINWIIFSYMIDSLLFYRLTKLSMIQDNPRFMLLDLSLTSIKNNLFFGLGIGNSGLALGDNLGVYPHNLFLEVLLELGVLGLTLFILPFICAIKKVLKLYSFNFYSIIFSWIFLYSFLTFQKSFGLLYGQFLLIPLCISISIYNIKYQLK